MLKCPLVQYTACEVTQVTWWKEWAAQGAVDKRFLMTSDLEERATNSNLISSVEEHHKMLM
jgi:hypothetical protein